MLLKVFSFFLIPLYTAYLQPDQYGILNLASGFTAVVSCIITMGFQYAVIRFYADLKMICLRSLVCLEQSYVQ